jgi:DNA modification methylase
MQFYIWQTKQIWGEMIRSRRIVARKNVEKSDTSRANHTLLDTGWDFVNANTQYLTHNYHPFPAKFIPQIPRRLMKELCQPNGIVFDPFCGSGTTLVEAQLLGHPSVGVDINPLFILISKVKTTPIPAKVLNSLANLEKRMLAQANRLHGQKSLFGENELPSFEIPEYPNRDHWFAKNVQKELALIKKCINDIHNKDLRDFCIVCLSSIIVRVSYQDSDTRYARKEKEIAPLQVCRNFMDKLRDMKKRMTDYASQTTDSSVELFYHDSRHLEFLEDEIFDLVVTSPPYMNAYDYHKYHRQRLYWLGMDPTPIRKAEIGGHDRYTKKNADPATYFDNMSECISEMHRLLKPGAYCCIVIGDAIVKKKPIPTHERLAEIGVEVGFNHENTITRNIDVSSKYFGHGSRIDKEYIIILRKS